jgi:hypothetical protein
MIWAGNFEFVNGGWDQHEDSCPHYADMLHNIFKGHQYLYNEFWVFPRVAWSLDLYGHSSTNARLYAESGIEAIFIKNIDPSERKVRLENQTMEYLWRPNYYNLGRKAQLFTHIFYDFDLSPFDLIIEDTYVNGTGKKVDPEEWEYYWGNRTYEKWWWDEDEYDEDPIDIDDDDWENWFDDVIEDWDESSDWWNNNTDDEKKLTQAKKHFKLKQQHNFAQKSFREYVL